MTDDRDFDRLVRAWLELGPDEAPDRVVAAVQQAAEVTPQVRRPLRWPTWRVSKMNRISQVAGLAAVLVVVIAGGILLSQRGQPSTGGPATSPSVAPTSTVTPSVSPSPRVSPTAPVASAAIVLQRVDAIACDAIGVDYHGVRIHLRPQSAVPVWAETELGHRLTVGWTAGFTATDGNPPVINGPNGEEVARDLTWIDVPVAAYPRLAGYFVCLAPDAIYVLETDPQ